MRCDSVHEGRRCRYESGHDGWHRWWNKKSEKDEWREHEVGEVVQDGRDGTVEHYSDGEQEDSESND